MEKSTHPKPPHASVSHRPTRFTPENIRQIINLVDRGKNREEIAEIIGVTPGTLAVTCSKLGISLRRPFSGPHQRPIRRSSPNTANTRGQPMRSRAPKQDDPRESEGRATNGGVAAAPGSTSVRPSAATFAVVLNYKNKTVTAELGITAETIGRLAMEAEFRGTKMVALIAEMVVEIANKDLFEVVLRRAEYRAHADAARADAAS